MNSEEAAAGWSATQEWRRENGVGPYMYLNSKYYNR